LLILRKIGQKMIIFSNTLKPIYNDRPYNDKLDITTNFYGRISCQLHGNPMASIACDLSE
jgi:hypothetical protein